MRPKQLTKYSYFVMSEVKNGSSGKLSCLKERGSWPNDSPVCATSATDRYDSHVGLIRKICSTIYRRPTHSHPTTSSIRKRHNHHGHRFGQIPGYSERMQATWP